MKNSCRCPHRTPCGSPHDHVCDDCFPYRHRESDLGILSFRRAAPSSAHWANECIHSQLGGFFGTLRLYAHGVSTPEKSNFYRKHDDALPAGTRTGEMWSAWSYPRRSSPSTVARPAGFSQRLLPVHFDQARGAWLRLSACLYEVLPVSCGSSSAYQHAMVAEDLPYSTLH